MSKWSIEWIITSSVLILVILVLRAVFKNKLNPGLKYSLWLLALIRLLIPFSFFDTTFSITNASPVRNLVQNQSISNVVYVDYELPDLAVPEPDPQLSPEDQQAVRESNFRIYEQTTEIAKVTTGKPVSIPAVLTAIWIIGSSTVALILLLSNIHFRKQLLTSRKSVQLGARLPTCVTPCVSTPCLFGFRKPVIYLTPEAVHSDTLRHILIHETTHYCHKDHIWSFLRCLCLVLHWFNPLVWIAAMESRKDSEIACDAATIRLLGESQRLSYGKTLIEMTCSKSKASDFWLTATTMTGSKRTLKDRVSSIARHPKTTISSLCILLLVVLLTVGCTFTGSNTGTAPTNSDSAFHYDPDAHYLTPTGVPFDSEIPVGTLADSELTQSLRDLFTDGSEDSWWYRQVLTSYFATPQTVNLYPLFYNGIPGADNTLVPEEVTYLAEYNNAQTSIDLTHDIFRIPLGQMEKIIRQYYGMELGDTECYGLGQFAYNPETNCLYLTHSDTNHGSVDILDIYNEGDGIVSLYYTYSERDSIDVVRLKQTKSGWQFLSNKVVKNYQPPTEPLPPESSEPEETTSVTTPEETSPTIPVSVHTSEVLTWTDMVGNECRFPFTIPAIVPFSSDAVEAQQEILEEYLPQLEYNRQAAEEGVSNTLSRIYYTAEVCENILSVVIVTETGYDYNIYSVYNFDLNTGARLDPQQTAEAFGLTLDHYLPLLAEAAEHCYREKYGETPEEFMNDPDFYLQRLEATLQEENLKQSLVFVSGYQLNAIVNIYSLAGASSYWNILPLVAKEPLYTNEITYRQAGSTGYYIDGYDASHIAWNFPDDPEQSFLYFANPRFLLPYFMDKTVEGSAKWTDTQKTAVEISFTQDAAPVDGTVTGPQIRFCYHLDTNTVSNINTTDYAGESITLNEEEITYIGSVISRIVWNVDTYHTAQS